MSLIPERVTALLDRCRREVDEGRIPGCQVAIGFEGDVVLFEAFGDLTTDQRLHTYSAVKPTVTSCRRHVATRSVAGPRVSTFASAR